jgi:hypothetical protein
MRVIIESPLSGDMAKNQRYARKCLKDSLLRGEAPYASHLLYTQVLDDTVPEEREMGIKAGFEWGKVADMVAVYTDLGISKGMEQGIENARKNGLKVVYRSLL